MLRESIEHEGESIDLEGLTDPSCTKINGIDHSEALLLYSNAFMSDDENELTKCRDRLVEELGVACMVDAAGVASNFQRMVRIADATGIPLEGPVVMMEEDLIEQLGTDKYVSASNTKSISWFHRLLFKIVVIPQIKKLMKGNKDKERILKHSFTLLI